jgi:membrane protease YdiL (CAAX protease family)
MINSAAPPRSPLRFFLLVFALSVPFWVVGAVAESQGFRPKLPMRLPVSSVMAFCPAIAAGILILRAEGYAGVTRLLRRSVDYRSVRPPRWYVVIVLLNPAIVLASYVVMRLLGRPLPEDPAISPTALPLLLLIFFLSAIGEEAGWTGYALDPLQNRWGALAASLLIGVVTAVWHLIPLLQGHHSLEWIAWKCLETVAARFLIVWLYNSTGRSLFAAVLFHALSNVSVSMFPNGGSHYDPAVAGVITFILAGIVAFSFGRGGHRQPTAALHLSSPRSRRVCTNCPLERRAMVSYCTLVEVTASLKEAPPEFAEFGRRTVVPVRSERVIDGSYKLARPPGPL